MKSCCEGKGLNHCGQCGEFPCALLHRFAYEMEQSDQGERIRQCERWREAENGVQ